MQRAYGEKVRHLAKYINPDGKVKALCFGELSLKTISLTNASWTLDADRVTCHKCLARVAAKVSECCHIELRARLVAQHGNGIAWQDTKYYQPLSVAEAEGER